MGLTYKQGQSSSLGVGLSASGAAGSFSVGGTSSVSSNASITYPDQTNWKAWQTQFQYAKFHFTCKEITTGYLHASEYSARPVSFVGGTKIVQQSSYPTANYCTSYVAGSSLKKDSTLAYKYSGGVLSSGTLGVNLTAQTGYDSGASVTFKFQSNKKLCGTDAYPTGNAKMLVAK